MTCKHTQKAGQKAPLLILEIMHGQTISCKFQLCDNVNPRRGGGEGRSATRYSNIFPATLLFSARIAL